MGYQHIQNLSSGRDAALILRFKTVHSLEKVHGTSSHVSWNNGRLGFFSGGENYERFVALFDQSALTAKFSEKFGADQHVTVYGEAYGGKQQGMSATYGKELRFVAFEVKIGDSWLSVPQAAACAEQLGFEFVDWCEVSTDLDALNAERDKPSVQAVRNGIVEPRPREGVVLRPPFEVTLNNGNRLIAKHKNPEFSERASRADVDPTKIVELQNAQAVADEFVVAHRLDHVIGQLLANRSPDEDPLGVDPFDDRRMIEIKDTGAIIRLMIEDVLREGDGEFEDTPAVRKALGAATAKLFKQRLERSLG